MYHVIKAIAYLCAGLVWALMLLIWLLIMCIAIPVAVVADFLRSRNG